MADDIGSFELNTGARIPSLGLGTWQSSPGLVGDAVATAVKAGYRHIDCAQRYGNEKEGGEAIEKQNAVMTLIAHYAKYEPVTTPCGHFMPISVNGSSATLNDIIQKNFPEEFAERKLENDTMTNFGVHVMPLFVMDVVLPFQKFLLLIF